ncbi:SusC/RagA family TonB-linked outer membrane protein [Catalinimonas niigatensis]|uniref:SusC/RagA family TonB-linked outer membrane protein n=1 Tax=Catalinimonas niigatensis TaxID=1397264 RepID=UPI002665375C|nr:SusC/RagA family TonB-linked outer membrane protein [Catalinimonas niigatensis]WPP53583.1 SusC/RagA family TonB-linked outer membrane protein [Catalinimonas niigatensis]
MMKHLLNKPSWLFLLFVVSLGAMAQDPLTYTVQGTVTDSYDDPLIGATVQLVGTNVGTVTDFNGNYQLTFSRRPGSYQLAFNYIGYERVTESISLSEDNTQLTLDKRLDMDLIGLSEVIVTGTSVATSKKQLGNAISTVSGESVSEVGAISVDQALAGKVAGALVQQNSGSPAGGISIRLRGVSTLAGSSDPLYIVDGVIISNSSSELVDLGGSAQNRLVDINPNDIERIEVIKGAAAAAIYGSRANNGVVQIFTKRGAQGAAKVTFSTSLRINELRKKIDINDAPIEFVNPTDLTDTETRAVERYDYQEDIFRTGYGTDSYLSVTGGNENTKYFVSGSYFLNQGIIQNADYKRYNGRIRLDQVLNDWASFSFGANYSLSKSNDVPNGGISAAYGALTGFSFSNNILPLVDEETGLYNNTNANANPLEVIEAYNFSNETNRFIGDFQLNLSPIEGLTIDYVLGIDTYSSVGLGLIPEPNTTANYPTGFSRRADRNFFQMNNDLNIGYQTEIVPGIQSTTALGGTVQYETVNNIALESTDLPPFVETAASGTLNARGESRFETIVQGAFLQETIGILDKVFLTGAIRVDASNLFAEEERTQFYPKVSGTYVISEEDFFQSAFGDNFNLLKFRSSYGEAGNLTGIGTFERFTNLNPTALGGITGLLPSSQRGTLGVRPERQKEFEVGVDMGIFNNRLGVEFTYYTKNVEDLLLNRTLAPTTGFTSTRQNVGTLENKGFEILVRGVPVQTEDLLWSVTGTLSRNTNVVSGIEEDFILLPGSFDQSAVLNDEAVGVFFTTYLARNPDGSLLLDANGLPQRERLGRENGQPSGALDEKVIGDPNPAYFWSLINEVDYKKFSFRVQFDAIQGYDIFNFTSRLLSFYPFGGGQLYEDELLGRLPKGYNAATFSAFDRHIEDGSFVKLRELALSYSTRPELLGISNLRLSLVGRNLLSFDNYSGWDPETNAAGQSNTTRGFDFNEVPIPRTYSFQLTATF